MSWPAQLATRLGVDGGVDGLMRHVSFRLVGEYALERSRNLLGRPLPVEQGEHDAPADSADVKLGARLGGAAPLRMKGSRRVAAVDQICTAVCRLPVCALCCGASFRGPRTDPSGRFGAMNS